MEVRDLPSRSPSNINQSEDVGHRPTTQQIEEDSLVLHTSTDAKVDTHAALLSNPQTNQTLPQDANALSRCSDSLVGTAIDIDPSQEENAQCGSNATAGSCTSSEQLGSDDTHLEGEEIIAKGIASVLGPVMRDFDARAEGALKSQGVLASSIDRLTRVLVASPGYASQALPQHAQILTSKGLENCSSPLQEESSTIDQKDQYDAVSSLEAEHA